MSAAPPWPAPWSPSCGKLCGNKYLPGFGRVCCWTVLSALVPANMNSTKQRQKDGRLCGLQNADHRHGGAENVQSAVISGDWLVVTWTGMEEVAGTRCREERTGSAARGRRTADVA